MIGYTNDVNGNRKRLEVKDGSTVVMTADYTYDILDRLTNVSFDNGSASVSYTYDANGNVLTETKNGEVTEYAYNKAGLMTEQTGGNSPDYEMSYSFDGKKVSETDSINGIKNYIYDGIGQLKSEIITQNGAVSDTITYSYDTRGNRVSQNNNGVITNYTYDRNNKLISDSSSTYTYDNNGNLLSKTTGETVSSYTYDPMNKLKSVTSNDGMTASYVYDAKGRRVAKTVNGVATNHVWDGDYIIREKNGSGTEISRYYRAGNKIVANKSNNATNYYFSDPHGNTISIGNNENIYTYDAFGNQTSTPANDTNPFRYCGEYFDNETGFVYLRNRYYDSSIGRFITEDPAKDGLNWYVYCHSDPVNFWDPTGFITDEEQEMYENGELAPGAYSFLMVCTYYYYLEDTEEDKQWWSTQAQKFRDSGYTDTGNKYWNWTLTQMSSRPSDGTISKEEHFFRNDLNIQFEWDDFVKINKRMPDDLKWRELPWYQSIYHKFSTEALWQGNNRKYVSACGHFEVVYTKENYLVNKEFNKIYMGTYNYYGPSQVKLHKEYDVDPYYKYGNVEE